MLNCLFFTLHVQNCIGADVLIVCDIFDEVLGMLLRA